MKATQWPFLDYLMRTNPITMALTPQKTSAFFVYTARRFKEESTKEKVSKGDGKEVTRTMLHKFLDAKAKHPDDLDDAKIQVLCVINLLAGTLSPSVTMERILLWVSQNPEGQERLYREIVSNSKASPVSLEEALNMPYLEGVVREGYRLSFDSDIALERKAGPLGLTLPTGEQIPAGFDIGLSHPSTQKDPTVFGAEPRVFKPERWLQAKGETEAEW